MLGSVSCAPAAATRGLQGGTGEGAASSTPEDRSVVLGALGKVWGDESQLTGLGFETAAQERQALARRRLVASAVRAAKTPLLRTLVGLAAASLTPSQPGPNEAAAVAAALPPELRAALAAGLAAVPGRGVSAYLPAAGDTDGPRSALRGPAWAAGRLYAKNLLVRPLDVVAESIVETTRWPGPGSVLAKAARQPLQRTSRERSQRLLQRLPLPLLLLEGASAAEIDAAAAAAVIASESTSLVCGAHRAGEPGHLSLKPAAALAAVAAAERDVITAIVLCAFSWGAPRAALPPVITELVSGQPEGLSALTLSRVLLASALLPRARRRPWMRVDGEQP